MARESTEAPDGMASSVPATHELRELVALGCRILGANGHDDYVWGHVSARDPDGRGVWMKAATFGFEEVSADEVILVGFDGTVLDGDGPRHAEWPIHTEVMRARADIHAVVHSHPPHCIALAASGQALRPVSHAGTMFAPPDIPRFTSTSELITTEDMGKDVADAFESEFALFLVNHGIVTGGDSVRDAVVRALILEKAAHQQMLANAFGGAFHWTPDAEALRKRATIWSEGHKTMMWGYLARRLDR